MDITPGTIVILHQGHLLSELEDWLRWLPPHVERIKVRGNQIARQRNLGAERLKGDWLLMLDSDCVPPLDALPRLLSHSVPIVSGVVMERFAPHDLCLTRTLEPPTRWTVDELPKSGLIRVPAAGTGCLLVRKAVLEGLERPWFRCGQIIPDLLMEDTEFCLRAAEAGFLTYADCGVRVGHASSCVLWPGKDGKMWIEWPGPGTYKVPVDVSRH